MLEINKDVFISHSSQEKDVADSIVDFLEKNEITCWVAPRNIDPGHSYPAQIVNAVRNCSVFVLLASKLSSSSEHVSSELERAFDYKKLIIPFMIDDIKFTDEQMYFLSRRQQIIAYGSFETGLETLKATITAHLKNQSKNVENVEKVAIVSNEDNSVERREQRFLSRIPNEVAKKYEAGFSTQLIDYIKNDEVQGYFYERLIIECGNIIKVIESARRIDILELEEIIGNMNSAKDVTTVSKHDAEFHRRLFAITGDDDFFEWWLERSQRLSGFIGKIWESIDGTEQFTELLEIHNCIFEALKDKDTDKAMINIQKHFAFLFFNIFNKYY